MLLSYVATTIGTSCPVHVSLPPWATGLHGAGKVSWCPLNAQEGDKGSVVVSPADGRCRAYEVIFCLENTWAVPWNHVVRSYPHDTLMDQLTSAWWQLALLHWLMWVCLQVRQCSHDGAKGERRTPRAPTHGQGEDSMGLRT